MPVITLPDGSQRSFEQPGHRRRNRRIDRQGPCACRAGGCGRRPARGHVARRRPRREPADRHGEGSRGPRDPAPLDGASAGAGRAVDLSESPGDDRPGHRGRLFLRLRLRAALHAGRPRAIRAEDARAREGRPAGAPSRAARATRRSPISSRSASTTRRRSSRRSRPARRSRSTARANGRTCAAARTCRRPASSARSS